jgi:phage FluMu protein Com
MQQGYLLRRSGPSFIYIKYRCSRCKKLDELFVRQEEWEDGLLHEITTDITEPERQRFAALGSITLDEMREFHHQLENLNTLPPTLTDVEEDR